MKMWVLAAVVLVVAVLGLYLAAKYVARREPYHTFTKLSTRQKIWFLKALVADPRVPRWIKALLFLLVAYLLMPIDLIPDFIPVLGYVDDVAIVLLTLVVIVRFTPRAVVTNLLEESQRQTPHKKAGKSQ